jgi:tetratricopeptide (TPR) repeat protein
MNKTVSLILFALMLLTLSAGPARARQSNVFLELSEKNFRAGNELLDQNKPAEALLRFQVAFQFVADETSSLFNGGLAAYLSGNFPIAADLWERLKEVDPDDWRVRPKLIQVYQALGRITERNTERAELIELWKSGEITDLSRQSEYCREQFEWMEPE